MAAAAAAAITAITAATAPMAATATASATENDDDVFNFRDARTGVHQPGVNLDNLIRVERVNTASRRTRDLQFALVNTCSVRNKRADISDYVLTNDIDVVLMTETWLRSGDAVNRAELTPGGFNLKDNPRPSGRTGGGVGVRFKTGIQCKVLSSSELNSFEYSNYELVSQKTKVDVHIIYRQPYSEKHRVTTATFFEEFQTYLSHAVQTLHSLLITGDFNIHMDIDKDADAIKMCDVLSMYDLTQHVTVPTHISGHTLDLIITRYNCELLLSYPVTDYMMSDHMFMCYRVNMPRHSLETRTISYRKLKQIGNSAFSTDLKDITNALLNITDINQLVSDYNRELRQLLDRHAPIKSKTIVVRPLIPWFDVELKITKVAETEN